MADFNVDQWWDYIGSIAPRDRTTQGFDIPDEAYDGLRSKFYSEVMSPKIASQGISPAAMRQAFLKATERPGKSAHPVLDTIAKSAVTGLVNPTSNNPDYKAAALAMHEQAKKEMGRQGYGPIAQTAAEMGGEAIGMAPYFASPTMGARAAGMGLAGKLGLGGAQRAAAEAAGLAAELGPKAAMGAGQAAWDATALGASKGLQAAFEIPTVGAVQGLYDGLKADDGHRLSEGLMGFAMGATIAAGFEGAVGLRGLLKSKGLEGEQADAIMKTMKGTGSPKDEAIANRLMNDMPNIGNSIEEYMTQAVKKAKATAQPAQPIEITKGSKVKITMKGADGNQYNLRDIDISKFDNLLNRVDNHLQKGGEIIKVDGDASTINKMYLQFEEYAKVRGEYELPVVLKGSDPEAGPLVLWKEGTPSGEPAANVPSIDPSTKAPAAVESPGLTSPEVGTPPLTPAAGDKITDTAILSRFTRLPDGRIVDKVSKDIYRDLKSALDINGIKYEMPGGKATMGEGSFVGPGGEDMQITGKDTHGSVGMKFLQSKGIDVSDEFDAVEQMLNMGFVRTRKDSIEINGDFINKDQVWKAVGQLLEKGNKEVYIQAHPGEGSVFGEIKVNRGNFMEFMDNPKKFFMQAKKGMKFEIEDPSRRNFLKQGGGALAGAAAGGPGQVLKDLAKVPGGEAGFSAALEAITGRKLLKRMGEFVLLGRDMPPGMNPADIPEAAKRYFTPRVRRLDLVTGTEVWNEKNYVSDLFMTLTESDIPKEMVPHLMRELEGVEITDLAAIGQWKHGDYLLGKADKAVPGFGKMLKDLGKLTEKDLELLGESGITQLKDLKGNAPIPKALKEKVSQLRTQAIEKMQRPTGMELQRTPAQLGEDGKSGVMMRFENGREGDPPFDIAGVSTEKPLYHRGEIPRDFPANARGATIPMGEGNKPIVILGNKADKATVYHEGMHGHFSYLGMVDLVNRLVGSQSKYKQLANAFGPETRAAAGEFINEEVVTYLTTAVRNNDAKMIDKFVKADDSIEHVMTMATDIASGIKQMALNKPDSLHQRTLVRRMEDVQRRAGTILDLRRDATALGHRVELEGRNFVLHQDGTKRVFKDRESILAHIQNEFIEPLNAPNLVDEGRISEHIPKFALDQKPGAPQVTSDPPLPPGPVKGGAQALSFYFRPFYAWLDTVAKNNDYPALYTTFKAIDEAVPHMDRFVQRHEQKLYDLFKPYTTGKRHDLYHYLEAPAADKPAIAQQLNLTAKELADAETLRKEFYDPLFTEYGIDGTKYIEDYAPRRRQNLDQDPSSLSPTSRLTKDHTDFFSEHERTGELDPKDTDLLRVSHTYLRIGARKKFLGEAVDSAAAMVNAKNQDGSFVLGTLQPLFKRHLEYIKGSPDHTQRIIDGAIGSAITTLNETIEQLNTKLPGKLQLRPIETDAREALGKFVLFSYAGTLGLRPITAIRDSLQVLLTTYPMLGGKYMGVGLKKAFGGATQGGKGSEAYKIAEQYGALMTHTDLRNLYTSGNESLATGAVTKFSEKMLKPLEWANNSNRLVSFWGHSERALDAIRQYKTDPQKMIKEAGLHYMDKEQTSAFVKEIASAQPHEYQDIAFRIGKEMTDLSQWNYRKGGHPGVYKYALGRLLGQYGTWPMNYVEFVRRGLRSGDGADIAKTGARWAAAHYAVLKAGEGAGIDTGTWVFTNPMAYQGSPIFAAALAAPTAVGDTQTSFGTDARSKIEKLPQISLPGGLGAARVFKAIVNDEPDLWKIMLGFDPLDSKEMTEGVHNLP